MTSDVHATNTNTISQTSKVGRKNNIRRNVLTNKSAKSQKKLKPMIKEKNVTILNVML